MLDKNFEQVNVYWGITVYLTLWMYLIHQLQTCWKRHGIPKISICGVPILFWWKAAWIIDRILFEEIPKDSTQWNIWIHKIYQKCRLAVLTFGLNKRWSIDNRSHRIYLLQETKLTHLFPRHPFSISWKKWKKWVTSIPFLFHFRPIFHFYTPSKRVFSEKHQVNFPRISA